MQSIKKPTSVVSNTTDTRKVKYRADDDEYEPQYKRMRLDSDEAHDQDGDEEDDEEEEEDDEEEEEEEEEEVDWMKHAELKQMHEKKDDAMNGYLHATIESDDDEDDDDDDDDDDKEDSSAPLAPPSPVVGYDENGYKHLYDEEDPDDDPYDNVSESSRELVTSHLSCVDQALRSFVIVRGLACHHIESYEYFLQFSLRNIIEGNPPMKINCVKQHTYHVLTFQNTKLRRPTIREGNGQLRYILPKEAHLRKQTYSMDILVDIGHKVYASSSANPMAFKLKENKLYQNVLFGRLPAMLMSSVCNDRDRIHSPYKSMLGQFIINGYYKVIVSQERLKSNTAYVHVPKTTRNGKQTMRCEIRSIHHNKIRSTSTLNILLNSVKQSLPEITVMIPFIKFPVPLVIVFRLLGISDVSTVVSLIVGTTSKQGQHTYKLHHVVSNMIYAEEHPQETMTMALDELLDWVGKQGSAEKNKRKRIQDIRHIIQNELLPHTGDDFSTPEAEAMTNFNKACHLAHAVRKLIRVFLGEIPPDDIDEQKNRNICASGNLIALLLRQLTRNMIKALHIQIFKAVKMGRYINISDFFSHRKITTGLNYAFSTGNWSAQRSATNNQTGICQVFNTLNRFSKLSHLRAVNKPLNRDGKAAAPRQTQSSQFGIICAAETPDGRSVGLLNVLAFTAGVRCNYPSQVVVDFIMHMAGPDIVPYTSTNVGIEGACVLINGILCGILRTAPLQFVERVQLMRQNFTLPPDISVFYDSVADEVIVSSYGMAGYRPLINMKHLHKLEPLCALYGEHPQVFWYEAIKCGVIQYLAKDEEATCYIAMKYSYYLAAPDEPYTHMELDASIAMYGVNGSTIPASNCNQAPRNIYQAGMVKQAIAGQALDYEERLDTKTFMLAYPQKPLVDTLGSRLVQVDEEPMMQTCVVAITTDNGFNVEDSICINQASLDRGLFRTYFSRTYKASESMHGVDSERLGSVRDMEVLGKKHSNYSKLEDDGTPAVNAWIKNNDVVIGKYSSFNHSTLRDGEHVTKRVSRDQSIINKERHNAVADKIVHATQKDNSNLRQVTVRTTATYLPQIGDKFASRHAQKGICAITRPQEDMIRNAEGVSFLFFSFCCCFSFLFVVLYLKIRLIPYYNLVFLLLCFSVFTRHCLQPTRHS